MTNERAIELLNRISDSQFDGIHGDERREALSMAVRALEGDGDMISRKMAIDAFVKYVADGYAESPNDFEGYMEIVKKLPSAQPEVLVCGSGELVQESDDLVKDLVEDSSSDLISRKAVMKEFSVFVRESNNSDFAPTPTWNDAVSLVGSIPSVQLVNYGSTKSDSSSQLKLNNDLISRKQAIEAFEPTHYKDWYTPTIIETLETLPSVQLVKEPDGLVKDLVKDCISRQDAINSLDGFRCGTKAAWKVIEDLPSAQPEHKKGKWIFHETENDRYDDMICPFCKTTYTVDAYRIDDIGFTAEDFNYCPNCGADMRGESE